MNKTHDVRESSEEPEESFASLLGPEIMAEADLDLRRRLREYLALPHSDVDRAAAVAQAHALISSARILGYNTLAQVCMALEQAADGPALQDHHAIVRREAESILARAG